MDIGTVNFDDLFDFSPEPPPAQEKGGESWERESARLTGDWGQGQQRLNTVRTITSAAAQAHQHHQVSHQASHDRQQGDMKHMTSNMTNRGLGRSILFMVLVLIVTVSSNCSRVRAW